MSLVETPGRSGLLISLADYFTLHGGPTEPALRENAIKLLSKVNPLLDRATADGVVLVPDQVSKNFAASGYRPAGVNATTSNAVTGSAHLVCRAVDVQDRPGVRDLAEWICRNLGVLAAYGLYCEDFRWTGGTKARDPWVHLTDRAPGSGKRIYIPYADPVKYPPNDPAFYSSRGLVVPA